MGCFVIAEAGVNHNGSLDLALALVDAAAEAGADAVKFQTFRASSIVAPGTKTAAYQQHHTGQSDQHALIQRLELSEEAHEVLAARCIERGIEFMSTPFDEWGLELLLRIGIRRIKIASGEVTNRPLIEEIAALGLPMILSTGMSSLDEVARAVGWIRDALPPAARIEGMLTILHCTSNYPAEPSDVNLKAMETLESALQLPVGYSDHTRGIAISLAAVAQGATVIEKHFTLDKTLPGPDHQASLDVRELKQMIDGIRAVEAAAGDGIKQPRESEIPVRALVRRSAFARVDLPEGKALDSGDLIFLRPGTGIGAEHARELTGKTVQRSVTAGTMLEWTDLA